MNGRFLLWVVAFGSLGLGGSPTQTGGEPSLERRALIHGGIERLYFVHFPLNKPPVSAKPLVFVLHGGGGADARQMAQRTGMNDLADQEDFIAVYPAGVDGQWNDGRGKTFRRADDNTRVDDVGFISAVIDELIGQGWADPNRVYVMGLSNGGMMTYRLGIELGHRLAAIAAVIANLPENLAAQQPARPLPVLIINGTDDPMMPWQGGPVQVLGKQYGTVLSTDRTVRYWTDTAKLSTSVTRALDDASKEDGCTVAAIEYRDPENPVEVVLYRIEKGGHNFPGANTPHRPRLLGRKCLDIDGPKVVWSFFKRHALPGGPQPGGASEENHRAGDWRPRVKQVGDPEANYLNVEFTSDGKYMVWVEGVGRGSVDAVVWHCGVDEQTGELIPPDGRGFRAFESTSWGRANPGCDQEGPYYVGADREGKLVLVRPVGPHHGQVAALPTPPDLRRRAIYPTCLPNQSGGFVLFIQNEAAPGAGVRFNGNAWVELQYISLAEPEKIHPIERQETPLWGFAPMDVGFVRWMRGRPIVTYGARSKQTGKVEVRAMDVSQPEPRPFDLLADGHHHIDPYSAVIGEHEWILTGADGTATSLVYRRPAGQAADAPFELFATLAPPPSTQLAAPSLAQSHEPVWFQGRLYTFYQVNDKGRNFFDTTFRKPGEIWLADLSSDPVEHCLIAPDRVGPVAEPEPVVTRDRVWLFYNRPMIEEPPHAADDQAAANPSGGSPRPPPRRGARLLGLQGVPRLALYRADVPLGGSD